jgi:type I restriction enzyme, R subunit
VPKRPLLKVVKVNYTPSAPWMVRVPEQLQKIEAAKKDEPFVLDFINPPDDIYRAFKPYYDATSLQESSDISKLEALKHELDQAQVYHRSEVDAFANIFYRAPGAQKPSDHAAMQKQLQPAVDRFKSIPDEEQRREFREKLNGYTRVYAFMSQIVPYADPEMEKLYSYGRFLVPHLPIERDPAIKLTDEVGLQYYRLERVSSGAITLNEGEPVGVKSPTDVGTGKAKDEKAPLSEIINALNDRFGTEFTEEDRLFFEQIKERAAKNEQIIKTARANPQFEKFSLGIPKLIEEMMIQRMGENDKIVTRYMGDPEFQNSAFPILAREILDAINEQTSDDAIENRSPGHGRFTARETQP